jgi:superfamily II DNA or RNA helicase
VPQLRDYQRECLDAILARYRAGVRRQLVCLPTGTGKTVIFAEFPAFFRMKNRMLVLAHREELLEQAKDKLLRANPALRVEIEQAGRRADPDAQVVVASVPTLGREGSKRLERLEPERFFIVVVDEAHHAVAETYKRVIERFGFLAGDEKRLLVGFTATPKRGDSVGLNAVFQEISFSRNLPEMIEAGYLCPIAGWRVETAVDLSRVRTSHGDFVPSQLSAAVNVTERNALVVKVFLDRLADRQTLVFCVDVAHTETLADAFRQAGVAASAVTGDTEPDARKKALQDFSAGRVRVLTNCMVLTEGYDETSIAGILLARPTKSSLLYTQMIGRGTRLHPGKKELSVVDIVDVTRGHQLVTLPSLFGLRPEFDLQGRTAGEAREALARAERDRPWVRTDLAGSLADLRYRCERIDLLDLELPAEIASITKYAWTRTSNGAYRLALGKSVRLLVAATIMGDWEVSATAGGKESRVAVGASVDDALTRAELFLEKEYETETGLVLRRARWRREPASEKQLKILREKGLKVPEGLTKGQASHVISMLFGAPPASGGLGKG